MRPCIACGCQELYPGSNICQGCHDDLYTKTEWPNRKSFSWKKQWRIWETWLLKRRKEMNYVPPSKVKQ